MTRRACQRCEITVERSRLSSRTRVPVLLQHTHAPPYVGHGSNFVAGCTFPFLMPKSRQGLLTPGISARRIVPNGPATMGAILQQQLPQCVTIRCGVCLHAYASGQHLRLCRHRTNFYFSGFVAHRPPPPPPPPPPPGAPPPPPPPPCHTNTGWHVQVPGAQPAGFKS